MKTWKILTLAIVLASVAAPLVARFTTWLSPAVKAGVFAVAPPLTVAVALVLYFNWRAKLKRQALAQDDRDELVRAA
jgi:urea transporter